MDKFTIPLQGVLDMKKPAALSDTVFIYLLFLILPQEFPFSFLIRYLPKLTCTAKDVICAITGRISQLHM